MPTRPYMVDSYQTPLIANMDTTPAPTLAPGTTIGQVIGAAFRLENSTVAVYDLLTQPTFEADPAFDNTSITKASPYWNDYRDAFIGVQSQEHWDYIAAKIEQEKRDRELLSAAGVGGMAAAMAAGMLSPTMLIPALTPLRGFRGIAAAAGLGALAAGTDEIALQSDQITRTAEESAVSILSGALFGAVLGGAASLLRVHPTAEMGMVFRDLRSRFEKDTALSRGDGAIPDLGEGSLMVRKAEDGTIRVDDISELRPNLTERTVFRVQQPDAAGRATLETSPQAAAKAGAIAPENVKFENLLSAESWQEVKRQLELPQNATRERVLAEAEARNYDGIEYKPKNKDTSIIEQLKQPENRVVQEGPLVRTPSASPEVVDAVEPPPSTARPGAAGAQAIVTESAGGLKPAIGNRALSQLSPVAQTIVQREFPLASDTMGELSTAGLRRERNKEFVPSARGGTVEARVGLYDAFIAKLVRIMDEHYTDYVFNGDVKGAFPVTRAAIKSTFRYTGGKLTREQFATEVSRAMFSGDIHPVAQVQNVAQMLRSEVYDPILAEAKNVGLFSEGDLFDDASYLARIYDTGKIDADPNTFAAKLAAHFEKLLSDEVAKASDRVKAQRAVLSQYVEDLQASAEDVAKRREEYKARLDAMGETDTETEINMLKDERKGLQEAIRAPIKTPADIANREAAKGRLEEVKAQIAAKEKAVAPLTEEKRTLRRRLRNLNNSRIALEEKRAAKLDRIDRVESDALSSLTAVLKKGMELQRNITKLSRSELARQHDLLANRLHATQRALDRRWAQLEKLAAEGDTSGFHEYLVKQEDKMDTARLKLADINDRLASIDDLAANREKLAEILGDLAVEATAEVNHLNLVRGRRLAKLEADFKKLDPAQVEAKLAEAKGKQSKREAVTAERFREQGFENFTFNFEKQATDVSMEDMIKQIAYERAIKARDTVQKLNNRVSGLHIIGEERGSELARVLSIPSLDIFDYLVTDIERVTRNYVRQVSADIELKRTFGDVDLKERFKRLNEEYDQVARKMEADGASREEIARMSGRYRQHIRNLTASIARLRHTWGIPDNPDGFAARAGKIMLDLSTLRLMGAVAISSIPDMGRLVMKHGLSRTFGIAFKGLVSDFKAFKMSAREIKLAGGALDSIIHSRAMAWADLLDEYVGPSIPERALNTLSSKMGQIAGFDYWTEAMKQLSAVLDNAKLMDSIDLVINGSGPLKDVNEAVEYLASNGIDEEMASRIWDEVKNGGGQRVNGLWLPNTEDWVDQNLVRAYRAALRQENNNTIITPGLEVPLIANASIANRLLFQFKSFALASHTKTVMAGLQQKDMAIVNGMGISLALGALSYYTWAHTVGGQAKEDMQNASWEKWLDESINRAGFFGAFTEVQRIAERIPLTAPYANFSGERSTRRAGSDLTEALLGSSFDTLSTATQVIAGMDDPTKSTVHQLRTLMPLQNVFYLRQLFTLMEEGASANLPERREK